VINVGRGGQITAFRKPIEHARCKGIDAVAMIHQHNGRTGRVARRRGEPDIHHAVLYRDF